MQYTIDDLNAAIEQQRAKVNTEIAAIVRDWDYRTPNALRAIFGDALKLAIESGSFDDGNVFLDTMYNKISTITPHNTVPDIDEFCEFISSMSKRFNHDQDTKLQAIIDNGGIGHDEDHKYLTMVVTYVTVLTNIIFFALVANSTKEKLV